MNRKKSKLFGLANGFIREKFFREKCTVLDATVHCCLFQ